MLDRLTIRARLTLVYGGLFLAAGALLLGGDLPAGRPAAAGRLRLHRPDRPDDRRQRRCSGTFAQRVESATPRCRSPTCRGRLKSAALSLAAHPGRHRARPGRRWSRSAGLAARRAGARPAAPDHRDRPADRRGPGRRSGLHERIALPGPRDEVKELADTFDTMLERLDHAFDGQRRFVANASHELRTPLTINRSLIEVAMRRRTASRGRAPARRDPAGGQRPARAADRRAAPARPVGARARPTRSYVDLADVVGHVVGLSRRPRPARPGRHCSVGRGGAGARRRGAARTARAEPGRERHPAQRAPRTAGCGCTSAGCRSGTGRRIGGGDRPQHRAGRAGLRDRRPVRAVPPARPGPAGPRRASGWACRSSARWPGPTAARSAPHPATAAGSR